MKVITDADKTQGKRVCKDFEINDLGECQKYQNYVQENFVLKNVQNMCFKIYELDPTSFLTLPGLAW